MELMEKFDGRLDTVGAIEPVPFMREEDTKPEPVVYYYSSSSVSCGGDE